MVNSNSILKLVESQSYYESDLNLVNANDTHLHSLHNIFLGQEKFLPQISSYFINKYTNKEHVVLDPFCGNGTISLEALLNGRISYASDIDLLSLSITNAKINPVTFPEIALSLQLIDTKRLVRLGDFERYFAPFYNIDTYKEILAVKEYLQNSDSFSNLSLSEDTTKIKNFIQVLMLSVLHGSTSAFLSSPTYFDVAISPEKQHEINVKYRIEPEHRQVISRLLKKASSVFEDHIPSSVHSVKSENKCIFQDARNLNKISSSSVDLIITEPPMFYDENSSQKQWLRNWFCGIDASNDEYDFFDETSWVDFMNESLMEFCRVLKPNKRIVLILRDLYKGRDLQTNKLLTNLIQNHLSRYFSAEKCLIEPNPTEINKNLKTQYKYFVIRKN